MDTTFGTRFNSEKMGFRWCSRTRQQIVIIVLAFVTLYSIVRLSVDPEERFFLLCRPENVPYVNCFGPNGHKHQVCHQQYPHFRAYLDVEAGKYGSCWSAFNYTNGTSKFKSTTKKNYHELFSKKCRDGYMRPFVNIENDAQMFHQLCSSCSIVFSSGRLLGANYGADIDSNECVIRLNNAPVAGYETDVGRKTTLRVVAHNALYSKGPQVLSVVDKQANYSVIVWDPPMSGKLSKGLLTPKVDVFKLALKLQKLRPKLSVFYGPSNYFDALWVELTGSQPNAVRNTTWISTGFYSFIIAMNTCDRIEVFGSLPDDFCKHSHVWAPYHYYPDVSIYTSDCYTFNEHQKKKGHSHKFFTEQKMFRQWATFKNITFKPF